MTTFDPSVLKLEDCHDADTLTSLLSLLLEPTPELHSLLVPSVLLRLTSKEIPPASFTQVIDISEDVADGWTWEQKGGFINGHPMIGEVKGGLSGKEQGGTTRPVVLARLKHLNELYCVLYPGLRYITFVNGRPRSAIVPEMERLLQIPVSPEPLPDGARVEEPALSDSEVRIRVHPPESSEWKEECSRALEEMFRIAKARLRGLGLE